MVSMTGWLWKVVDRTVDAHGLTMVSFLFLLCPCLLALMIRSIDALGKMLMWAAYLIGRFPLFYPPISDLLPPTLTPHPSHRERTLAPISGRVASSTHGTVDHPRVES